MKIKNFLKLYHNYLETCFFRRKTIKLLLKSFYLHFFIGNSINLQSHSPINRMNTYSSNLNGIFIIKLKIMKFNKCIRSNQWVCYNRYT